jgi:surfeit locus 1 family protein
MRRASPRARFRALIVPGLCALMALGVLCSLGVWQLQRLAWKEALIARIATQMQMSFVPWAPGEAEWPSVNAEQYEYRHVRVTGAFRHDLEALCYELLSDANGKFSGPGYWVLTPLETAAGATFIVNRGFVPLDRKDAATRREGQVTGKVTIIGLLRLPERRSWFTPADDPVHHLWQVRDPAAIAKAYGLSRAAPFFIDADASANPGGLPQGGETKLVFPNRHLEYAITWFGLALALIAVFIAFALKQLRNRGRA